MHEIKIGYLLLWCAVALHYVAFCRVRIGNSVIGGRVVAALFELLGETSMSNPKSALAAAAILSLTMIGSAAAMPADNLTGAAKASVGIQQARLVCGPFGCVWRHGPRFWGWHRPLYGFYGPRWHGGWGPRWHGGWAWRHPWRWRRF